MPRRALALVLVLAASSSRCSSDPAGGSDGEVDDGPNPTATDTGMTPTTGHADDAGHGASTGGHGSAGSTGEPALPGPWDEGWPIPEHPQVPGDPGAGYQALLTRGYVSCGVPYAFWGLAKGDERKYIHHTTKPGHANTGHLFGDHLGDAERAAVLEYIKTI